MSDAPRWPGADGKPGLNFSPYRSDKPDGAAKSPSSGVDQDTQVHSAPSPAEKPAAASQAAKTGDAKAAPVAPRVAERAARTAKEWASMPVTPGLAPTPAPARVPASAGSAAPVPAPAPVGAAQPGRRTGTKLEDAESLPLDEVAEAKPAKGAPVVRRPRRTRKARLRLARLDPWSVMKTTFLFAIAFGIMLVVATFVLWSVLAGAGTLDYVNTLLNQLFGDQDTEFDVTQILSVNRILGFSSIVAAINVVIITALATLFAFLYNLAATVMGGLEVTLAED